MKTIFLHGRVQTKNKPPNMEWCQHAVGYRGCARESHGAPAMELKFVAHIKLNGFRTTGIWPIDCNVFDNHDIAAVQPTDLVRQPSRYELPSDRDTDAPPRDRDTDAPPCDRDTDAPPRDRDTNAPPRGRDTPVWC
ncbi:hypothetical protein LSAT2_000062 [Lamellibrachia satsuma]|nr:hypothetical protein LSAT2_000062 [Lamellibrachia satsuma]